MYPHISIDVSQARQVSGATPSWQGAEKLREKRSRIKTLEESAPLPSRLHSMIPKQDAEHRELGVALDTLSPGAGNTAKYVFS
jgi:hypothetical protein